MNSIKRHAVIITEGIFLIFIFFASQLPLRDFDIWFHLKSGELFIQQGHLQATEVFSYTAYGRPWTTFEWLFQIVSYWVSTLGLWAIPPFVSVFVVIGYYFLLRILRYIFGLPLIPRLLLVYGFWVSTYEFNTARPHTIAYTFLIIELFLILAKLVKGKNWIWFSPIITLIWTNVHSTGFLSWGFFLSFGLIVWAQRFITKRTERDTTARDLLLLAGINFLITLAPPMGIADYQLLWRFFRERKFLGYFISEWGPPQDNPFGFHIYTASLVIALGFFLYTAIREKRLLSRLTGLPFILMAAVGYSATRNIYLGTLGIFILFGWSLSDALRWLKPAWKLLVTILCIIFFIGFYTWVLWLKYGNVTNNRLYYPLLATEFIRHYQLTGHMFNDYNYGAYMLYRLYPEQKVFIDGRADVYECCEMRDYLLLAANKRMNDADYRIFLNSLWKKYDVSYAVIVTTKHNVMRRIATLLNTDPDWALVFWDDDSQIFVRRDGKNDAILAQFASDAATPYLRNPYVNGKEDTALTEYKRMDAIAKSARTSNAIGFLLLKMGQFAEAKSRFEEAVTLDPTFESPYMNLAELTARDGNPNAAIDLYFKAYRLAPDRGLIYVRLGELILDSTGDRQRVIKIWKDGIKNTVDEEAKTKLKALVSSLKP